MYVCVCCKKRGVVIPSTRLGNPTGNPSTPNRGSGRISAGKSYPKQTEKTKKTDSCHESSYSSRNQPFVQQQ